MSSYEFKSFHYSSHEKILNLVENNKKILDVGCSKGFIAQKLKEKGCEVTGIDNNKEDLEIAKKYCNKVILLDITKEAIKGKYDIIILGDVIEHLPYPEKFLKSIKKNLEKEGYIITSVPNIANIYARIKILFGSFDYEEKGIFDRTHLRFFTLKTFRQIIRDSGYSIENLDSAPIPISLYFRDVPKLLLIPLYSLFIILNKVYPRLFAYQFIAKIK